MSEIKSSHSFFYLKTLVSFACKACKTKNRAFLRVDEKALAIKNSFRYTSEWLPTAQLTKGVFLCPKTIKVYHTQGGIVSIILCLRQNIEEK